MHLFRRLLSMQSVGGETRILVRRKCNNALFPATDVIEKQNRIFSQEQKRQLEEVGRVNQIAVEVFGPPEDVVLMMNQNISTPYDCCKHISLPLCRRSPLALINDQILWDMHRPLPGNCKIRFLSFRDKDPYSLNETFWRTGSFVLGAVIQKAFKSEAQVQLQEFPQCQLNTGSFIYDVKMGIQNWEPTLDELQVLSAEFTRFVFENHKIERLNVKKTTALQIFEDNPAKLTEIGKNAAESDDKLVTLYRVGDHIDISHGPMVGDTSFFGRCTVAAVHNISLPVLDVKEENIYRFQGVSLPKGIMLNSFAYGILVKRATTLNEIPLPNVPDNHQPYSKLSVKNSNTPISSELTP